MNEAAHVVFITWSYIGVGVVTAALIGYVVWDARRVKNTLAALDKAGIRRRSADPSSIRADNT